MPYADERRDLPSRSTPQIEAVRRVLGRYRRATVTPAPSRVSAVAATPRTPAGTPPRAG
ncbi:hypothetical protein C8N24_4065 [Solirubrobacter pauli]|uniref:Uncharacterized protein n=1 Tax=Solirubrobacter pauli TaxID=166793 RepID=A0A660KWL4_9ACTN|nr:hypothetical protein [Solirubrobacter pauli]RKQ86056.1 hypothetical protein C8N24_4065 [Solirubrobacter pauli]